jgi:endonuclease YncB( thermonuclease family)
VAVNNSLLRPGCDIRPFRAVMRFCRSFFAAFGLCCAIAGSVSANSISGRASVIDGDTIEIRGERIRLVSVDAPESRQTCLDAGGRAWRCGQQAALALSDMIGRSSIVCLSEGRDQYDRILGQCSVSNVGLSAWLIENGWAVPYNDREGRHYPAARRAEDARRGIWAGSFERPSDWRRRN